MMTTLLLLQATPGHPQMTAGGWAFLIVAWLLILGLTLYTFSLILRSK